MKEKKKKNSSKTPRDRGNLQKDSTHPKEQRAFGKKGIVQKAKRPLHLHKFFRLFEYTCTETKALAAQNPPSRQMHRLCASGSLRVWPPQAAKSAGKKGDTKKTSDFRLQGLFKGGENHAFIKEEKGCLKGKAAKDGNGDAAPALCHEEECGPSFCRPVRGGGIPHTAAGNCGRPYSAGGVSHGDPGRGPRRL